MSKNLLGYDGELAVNGREIEYIFSKELIEGRVNFHCTLLTIRRHRSALS
jgi:hypothetical protein